jgi:hypothetical protein
LDYKKDSIELAAAAVIVAELREISFRVPTVSLSLAMRLTSGVFKATEDAQAVQIDAEEPTKTV